MFIGHSPLNIKSIILTKPALCDIYFFLQRYIKKATRFRMAFAII